MRIQRGKLLLAMAALIWLGGCASIGPPLPPSLELPHPPSDLKAVRKGNKVTLTWTIPALTTDRQSVRYLGRTQICRSVNTVLASCGVPVGEVAPPPDLAAQESPQRKKLQATFSQELPVELQHRNASAVATYAVEVLNRADHGAGLSNPVHVPLTQALPSPENFSAQVTAQGVLLEWTEAPGAASTAESARRSYRVYRRAEGSQQKILVGEKSLEADDRRPLEHPSILDQSFEWEKTYFYHADTLIVIPQAGKPDVSIEGDDTPEVKVFVHDIFPPAVPSGVEAVFSSSGRQALIDLIWAPVTDADLAGYNIYRREEGSGAVKVNPEPVKIPAFRDTQVMSGKKYLYSVSAVDQRGNESGRSEEAGESVP
jgi:hypothetical protein